MKIKNFVTFLSPGTMISESTTEEIESWCPETAIKMSNDILERHNSKPYGFYFTKRELAQDDFDSKETERSGIYHLGGKMLSIDDIKLRDNSKDSILISNMECNGWSHVVENNNSWKITTPFLEKDTFLNV